MAGKTDYKNAWLAEKLDRINLTVPKGKKEIIQKLAADLGLSVNAFINQAIVYLSKKMVIQYLLQWLVNYVVAES